MNSITVIAQMTERLAARITEDKLPMVGAALTLLYQEMAGTSQLDAKLEEYRAEIDRLREAATAELSDAENHESVPPDLPLRVMHVDSPGYAWHGAWVLAIPCGRDMARVWKVDYTDATSVHPTTMLASLLKPGWPRGVQIRVTRPGESTRQMGATIKALAADALELKCSSLEAQVAEMKPKLLKASAIIEQAEQFLEGPSTELLDHGCSCHLSPPCNYCTSNCHDWKELQESLRELHAQV